MHACSLTGAIDPLRKLPVSNSEVWTVGRSRRILARQCWPTKKLSAWEESRGGRNCTYVVRPAHETH